MKDIMQFGESVDGYQTPVLNEREIRAAAGLYFLFMFTSVLLAVLQDNFVPIKFGICIFLTDFLIRVFLNPRFSPSLILGRMIVREQTPEYVDAAPKKFAWVIGVLLASVLFIHLVLANLVSIITGILCLACLIFLFFESVFGICLGCKFYPIFFKKAVHHCAGDACTNKSKHDIQKASVAQVFVLTGFIALVFTAVIVLSGQPIQQPSMLF